MLCLGGVDAVLSLTHSVHNALEKAEKEANDEIRSQFEIGRPVDQSQDQCAVARPEGLGRATEHHSPAVRAPEGGTATRSREGEWPGEY